ncbi:MAG: homoserine O-acetyltransferase MetX [Pirellulaceae bacterium]
MTNTNSCSSSDSDRHARPLQYAQRITLDAPLPLELGGLLTEVTVVYEVYGQLNARRDNAVLVCHAISGDSHVARHDAQDDPGWWDIMVGPSRPIDTDRYCVVCPNILGGCRGTSGPHSMNPKTGRPAGIEFPVITVDDMVEVQKRLVDHLGIERLLAVVGGSLGGHMVLTWATKHPDRVAGAVALATSPRLTSQAVAFDVVGRNAILRDPAYQSGKYYDYGVQPSVGLAIARMLGHITYLSREAMMQKFDTQRLDARGVHTQFETKFAVGSYLAYQGDRFVERFDANSYLTLTMALDLFDLGSDAAALSQALGASQCRWLLLSYSSDWLFPSFQSQELLAAMVATGKSVSYCDIQTDCGHDAFLLPNDLHSYGEMIRAFLANLSEGDVRPGDKSRPNVRVDDRSGPNSTSIFHPQRLDYDSIVALVPPEASVLDLGCGTGELLARLQQRGHQRTVGVEIDETAILECVRRGLDVIHGNLNLGLPFLGDAQFDCVILSQTLQAVSDVKRVVHEMLRVGRRAIVSFSNLAFREYRSQLAECGRAPRLPGAETCAWYDTPIVRFLSITDFIEFCGEQGIRIHEQIALDTQARQQVDDDPNLNADLAIFVLGG